MIKKIVVVFTMLCVLLVGCGDKQDQAICEYERIQECDMGEIVSNNSEPYHITEQMKEHSVKIKNQKISVSGYDIKLDEYFYNRNAGVAVFKFIISAPDASALTEEQYNKLVKLRDDGELNLVKGRSSRPFINLIQKDEKGQAVWYHGCLLSGISPQSKVTDKEQNESLRSVGIYFMKEEVGEITLPDYDYQEKVIEFDTSKKQEILSVKMTESGLCIIWNIEDVLAEFREMIKQLPKGENPEDYNYSVYKNISIHMKDGTKYNVLDAYCDEEIREENNIASFRAIWKDGISLEKVKCLEIDGVKYNEKGGKTTKLLR